MSHAPATRVQLTIGVHEEREVQTVKDAEALLASEIQARFKIVEAAFETLPPWSEG